MAKIRSFATFKNIIGRNKKRFGAAVEDLQLSGTI
jgi:hypothetical protein